MKFKIIAAAIVAFAFFSLNLVSAQTFTDVAEYDRYYDSIEELSRLGIFYGYPDGSFRPDEYVTRAEMAVLMIRCENFDEDFEQDDTIFSDVQASHWASGYIESAANQEIVTGNGDGTFLPDNNVKYEETLAMILNLIGYRNYAKENGGYPEGYIAAAQLTGITDGLIGGGEGVYLTRGQIAKILHNSLDAPMLHYGCVWSGDTLRESYFYEYGNDAVALEMVKTLTDNGDGGYSIDFNNDGIDENIYIEDGGYYAERSISIYNAAKGEGEAGLCGQFVQMHKTSECYILNDTSTGICYMKVVNNFSDASVVSIYALTGEDFECIDTWGRFVNKNDQPYVTLYRIGFDAVELGYEITGEYEFSEEEYYIYGGRYDFDVVYTFRGVIY